jgi:hypothetical protein
MYQLNPAPLDSQNIKEESKNIYKKPTSTAKTYKNRKTVNFAEDEPPKNKLTNLNNLLSKLHANEEDEEDDNNFKEQYNQPTNDKPISANTDIINNELKKMNSIKDNLGGNGNYLNGNINSTFSNYTDSYKPTINYLNNENENQQNNTAKPNNGNLVYDNNQLLTKLDYIIHLLEEQHNEKTNHITEELILYLFLGIFIIFVLDSFARASKYVR